MEEQIKNLEAKIDAVYFEVQKLKKYFRAVFWITIILFALPLIAILFVFPTIFSVFNRFSY